MKWVLSEMKHFKIDAYDGMSFFGGLVFFAPVALLVRTQAGISEGQFFLLQVLLSAVIALGELPTGYLTDRIGYRSSLMDLIFRAAAFYHTPKDSS